MRFTLSVAAFALLSACSTLSTPAPVVSMTAPETPITFEARSGEQTAAFVGTFTVPENRLAENSRELTLSYVRFPATTDQPGAPIIYLSGGPGGSGIGTAKGNRYPLFMAMREFGDVIALDQRGTGASNDMPYCASSQIDPDTEFLSDREFIARQKLALEECFAFWEREGIDVDGYDTVQNAADLDDLRVHLGADKVSLWGISYGSHLTFAALKEMDDRIERVVIASAEGLNQTIKLPARTDAYFERLEDAMIAQGLRNGTDESLESLIRRVHRILEAEPLMLDVPLRDGETAPFLLQRRDLQTFASGMISDPQWAVMLIGIYEALDAGETAPVTQLLSRWMDPDAPIGYRPMSIATDLASGTSPERRTLILEQAQTGLVGRYLNHEVELEDVQPQLSLGAEFRALPVSDVPVLLLSGTLDGRTYIESQIEAVSGLTNTTFVTVDGAGHNLFMSDPQVTHVIERFMRGEEIEDQTITASIPKPEF